LSGPGASQLSLFDAFTVIVSVIVASVLMATRRLRGVHHRGRQWLDDALNVGTIILLVRLVLSSFPGWTLPAGGNPVTDIALIYCAGLIAVAMYRSIQKPKG